MIAPVELSSELIVAASLVSLSLTGALAAKVGGAPMIRASLRVTFWGAIAMGVTAAVGWIFGQAV